MCWEAASGVFTAASVRGLAVRGCLRASLQALRLPGNRRRCYIPPYVHLREGDLVRTVDRADGKIRIIDQTRLPAEEFILSLSIVEELAEAISSLRALIEPPRGTSKAALSGNDKP